MGQMHLEPGLNYLSWSRLSLYNGCGEKYRLRYLEQVPGEPSGAALAGKAMHAAILDAEAAESWTDPEDEFTMQLSFLEHFTQAVDEAGGPEACRWGGRKDRDGVPSEGYLWWTHHAGPLFCRRFAHIRRTDEEQDIHLVENGCEFEVTVEVAGRLVVGYIDALMVDGDGTTIIRDWKTGKSIDAYQLGVYSWLLANSTRGITADIGEIGYLRNGSLKLFNVQAWRELVPRMLDELVRGVEADLFPLRPSPFCVACDVRHSCEYGRTLDG